MYTCQETYLDVVTNLYESLVSYVFRHTDVKYESRFPLFIAVFKILHIGSLTFDLATVKIYYDGNL